MNVVVGYVPTPEGESALHHALEEARGRKARLLVVNTSRGDALVDERFADELTLRLDPRDTTACPGKPFLALDRQDGAVRLEQHPLPRRPQDQLADR
jgi:hypothetical protein